MELAQALEAEPVLAAESKEASVEALELAAEEEVQVSKEEVCFSTVQSLLRGCADILF